MDSWSTEQIYAWYGLVQGNIGNNDSYPKIGISKNQNTGDGKSNMEVEKNPDNPMEFHSESVFPEASLNCTQHILQVLG